MDYTIKIPAQHLQFLINILEGLVLPVPMNYSLPIHQSLLQQRRDQDRDATYSSATEIKRPARKSRRTIG